MMQGSKELARGYPNTDIGNLSLMVHLGCGFFKKRPGFERVENWLQLGVIVNDFIEESKCFFKGIFLGKRGKGKKGALLFASGALSCVEILQSSKIISIANAKVVQSIRWGSFLLYVIRESFKFADGCIKVDISFEKGKWTCKRDALCLSTIRRGISLVHRYLLFFSSKLLETKKGAFLIQGPIFLFGIIEKMCFSNRQNDSN